MNCETHACRSHSSLEDGKMNHRWKTGHGSHLSDPGRQYFAAIGAKSPLELVCNRALRCGGLSLFNSAGGFRPTRAAILAEPRVKRFDPLKERIESPALCAVGSLEIRHNRTRLIVNVLWDGLLHH